MGTFADTLTIFHENSTIFFILIVLILLIGLFYFFIEPTLNTLMGAIGA